MELLDGLVNLLETKGHVVNVASLQLIRGPASDCERFCKNKRFGVYVDPPELGKKLRFMTIFNGSAVVFRTHTIDGIKIKKNRLLLKSGPFVYRLIDNDPSM
jgi:hypothetical protein